MKIDGACHCGAITYEGEIDPANAGICHCTDCQTLSGTAFRTTVYTSEADFKLLSGQPKTYVKTAASGNKRAQAFCADCGSPIYATSVGPGPKVLGLRVGAIRQRDDLPPRKQYWAGSAQPWLGNVGFLPKIERQ